MKMDELVAKAAVLHEALPYIRQFHRQIFVVKYGGHAMIDDTLRRSFARDIVLLKYVGLNPVVVHGGGPQVDEVLSSMGVVSDRIDGLRITDDKTMDVVEMVIGGKLNQEIVSLICGHGGRAVGLSGKDDRFIRGRRAPKMRTKSGDMVDPGRVGEIETIEPEVVHELMDAGFIPVIAPIACAEDGSSLNVNADTVAGRLAAALKARKLVLMTDTHGVLDAAKNLLSTLTADEIARLKREGTIVGGMIPKVDCALDALERGVDQVHVLDGRVQHAVLLELFTDQGIGTQIVK